MSENTSNDIVTLSSYPRAIVHVDCDAFFVSCEQARDPSLKNRPVVTGKERGIIASASYEAKALGVKRGVSLYDAKRFCPQLVVLPSDYETYSIYSERLFSILRSFTPEVEEFSIDEAFCDITGLRRYYRSSYSDIVKLIRERIHNELDITVSAGLSLTKTLAKICSRWKKPDGFTALPGRMIHEFLKKVPLEMVCGFGPNTVALLSKCGIGNVLDYIRRPVTFADRLLGKIGTELWHELRGDYIYKVSSCVAKRPLTISKTKTFSPPSSDRDTVKAQLLRNLESAFIKLRRHDLSARGLAVYLKRQDFTGSGIEAKLSRHSASTLDFTGICIDLFNMIYCNGTSYRSTGVVLFDIEEKGVDNITLFDDPIKVEAFSNIAEAMDDINEKFGKYSVHLAATTPALNKDTREERNDLAWRKTDLLKGETLRKRLRMPLAKFTIK